MMYRVTVNYLQMSPMKKVSNTNYFIRLTSYSKDITHTKKLVIRFCLNTKIKIKILIYGLFLFFKYKQSCQFTYFYHY